MVAQPQFDEMHLVLAVEAEIEKPIGRMDRRVRNLNDVSYDDIVASGDCRRRADAASIPSSFLRAFSEKTNATA